MHKILETIYVCVYVYMYAYILNYTIIITATKNLLKVKKRSLQWAVLQISNKKKVRSENQNLCSHF